MKLSSNSRNVNGLETLSSNKGPLLPVGLKCSRNSQNNSMFFYPAKFMYLGAEELDLTRIWALPGRKKIVESLFRG